MKMSKKIIAIGVTSALLFSGISFAYANNLLVDVNAKMDFETKLVYDGKNYESLNSNNEAIRPIILDGEIYLPEKMIEEMAGINIDYDADIKELSIGEKSEKNYFSEKEFHPVFDSDEVDRMLRLYYTENPKELFVNNRMFKTALKAKPDTNEYSDYYFNTIDVRGKVNVIGGSVYVDKSVPTDNVKIMFRNSMGEGAKVLEYLDVKPGAVIDFEIETKGSDIVIMDTDSSLNKNIKLENLSFFDLYYK